MLFSDTPTQHDKSVDHPIIFRENTDRKDAIKCN